MNFRRVQSSFTGLERDVANCEMLVCNVVKGKDDRSKSHSPKMYQNTGSAVSKERSLTAHGACSQAKSPSQTNSKTSSQKFGSSTNRLLCKEVIENSSATVEVTVKARTSSADKNRKRPRSNMVLSVAETDGRSSKYDKKQQSTSASSKVPNKKKNPTKKALLHSKNKHLSWAHILKDNGPCFVHSENEKDGQKVSSIGDKITNRKSSKHNKHFSTYSSDSSGLSDQEESIHYSNKSVQCHLLENTGSSNKQDNKPSVLSSKLSGGDDVYSSFSVFNPVRTLGFLINELHGKIKKSGYDDHIQRIIVDMEQAVGRIPLEAVNQEQKENIKDNPSRDKNISSKHNQFGFVPLKPEEPLDSKPILVPKAKYPEKENLNKMPLSKTYEKVASFAKERNETSVPEGVEIQNAKLELNFRRMEIKYEQMKKENELLNEQMKLMKEQLEMVNSREKDYLTTINYLKSNLQTVTKRTEDQALTISELNANNIHLKEENKKLLQFREKQAVLSQHLKESTENEGKIHAQLQIMKLEREKFDILLAGKNRELEKFKQELRDIQAFVSQQLSSLKSFSFNNKNKEILNKAFDAGSQLTFTNKDSDLESVTLFLEKAQTFGEQETMKPPICSSPTSSIPSTLGVDSSWMRISRISSTEREVKKKASPEVLVLSPPEIGKMKDSDDEIDLMGNHKSFPLMKSQTPDFKSFLLESSSENNMQTSRNPDNVRENIEPKSCQDIKDELRGMFERIKKQTSMGLGLSLPSPPHHYSEVSEPGGMSQWSELSDAESFQNASYIFKSNTDMKHGLYEISASDVSVDNKSETDVCYM